MDKDKTSLMSLQENSFIPGKDVYYPGLLKRIKKSKVDYQAIWEIVTNALEAIHCEKNSNDKNSISIRFYYSKDLNDTNIFDKVEIEDSGEGFSDSNFARFLRINDDSKGQNNRGSGRIQILHTFEETEFRSRFNENGQIYERVFYFSGQDDFLSQNAIIKYISTKKTDCEHTGTTVICKELFDDKNEYYSFKNIDADKFKKKICDHYLPYFCSHQKKIPQIVIQIYVDDNICSESVISSDEIPAVDKNFSISIPYVQYDSKTGCIEHLSEHESFDIQCFKLNKNKLKKNKISIVCKGEVVPGIKMELGFLKEDDSIDENRYLIFISGNYFDLLPGDTRDDFVIPSMKDLKKDELFSKDKVITYEDIAVKTNSEFLEKYPEVQKKKEEYNEKIQKLKEMFLLNSKSVTDLLQKRNNYNISEQNFLQEIYEIESKQAAKNDAEIKREIDEVESLNPVDKENYGKNLSRLISNVVQYIPLQNRTSLSHYVARRKIVLDLFEKALENQLEIQKNRQRNIDEKILHNILFQQSSSNPEQSDLWIISEEYIYFKGTSNIPLGDVKLDGVKLFKEEFTQKEMEYITSLRENRLQKKPDVLLFPQEGKCIIIEFKNPAVNVKEHLEQINQYASLIRRFSSDHFPINAFYGYLIGEAISPDDILSYDADFKEASYFDYLYRSRRVYGGKNRPEGDLYMEVIKYSTLLKRAKQRNEIFIKKLFSKEDQIV